MSIKGFARSLCPPLLWRAMSAARRAAPNPQRFSGHYRTYEEANRHIAPSMWQHVPPDSAESSIAAITTPSKELVWNERLMALALLQAVGAGTINVIDFGGSFGLHLSTFLKVARNTPYLWTIIEIPTIVDEGRKRIPPGAALHYETEIEQGPASPDLIITSGTLQYLATPGNALPLCGRGAEISFY